MVLNEGVNGLASTATARAPCSELPPHVPPSISSPLLPHTLGIHGVRICGVWLPPEPNRKHWHRKRAILKPRNLPRDETRLRIVLASNGRIHLSDHFKSGQQLSLQNRPTGLAVRD